MNPRHWILKYPIVPSIRVLIPAVEEQRFNKDPGATWSTTVSTVFFFFSVSLCLSVSRSFLASDKGV